MDSTPINGVADDGLEELESIFIAETFHTSQPIREKPLQSTIPRVWIKDKRKTVKNNSGVVIELEAQPKVPLNTRFAELIAIREESGIFFPSDLDKENGDNVYDYEDIEDTPNEQILLRSTKLIKRSTKSNIAITLAKKLKKMAVANRLGVAYNPTNCRLRDLRCRIGTYKSWSQKFGSLLAARKLLYLPLLFRKYKMGPKKTREELDTEIDLYMAEVRKDNKFKLVLNQIIGADTNGTDDNNNGLKIVKSKELFGHFDGPGWKKPFIKTEEKTPNRDELDMEIDQYMANKGTADPTIVTNGFNRENSMSETKEDLDSDIDHYMASVKKRKEVMVNGY